MADTDTKTYAWDRILLIIIVGVAFTNTWSGLVNLIRALLLFL